MGVYNRVYTKEKWDNVNIFNKDLLNDYILQIKSEGKSEGSQKQYFNDARIIMIYVLEELGNKPLYKLNRKSFRNMILWMQENGMSSARINRMLSTSRNLLNFGLEDEEFEEDFEDCKLNPSKIKGMQKEKVRDIIFLTDEEVHIIVGALLEQEQYSQALLCALLYDSCSRKNEIYQIKRSDISLDANICKSQVIGKRGKKYRPLYNELTKNTFEIFDKNVINEYDTLWLTRSGTPASIEAIYNWVTTWRDILNEKTGVYKEFNVHSYRHSCCQNLKDGTHYLCKKTGKLDLTIIQKLMNHSDLATTQSYCKEETEDELLAIFN